MSSAREPLSATPQDTATGGTLALNANDYPLQPGDAIRLQFWREPELNGEFPVDERGTVVLPILGERTVTMVSGEGLKREILAEYSEQIRNQAVQMTLLRRVTIYGAVNRAGLYFLDPTMSVADAVALAGGSRREGQFTGVKIFRDGDEIHSHLDTAAPVLSIVRSGDQILVPERSWASRNTGVIIGTTISVLSIVASRIF